MKKAKEKQRTNKNQKGITLIALVVTIVILLILAGITITTLFGENGLITTAKLADKKTQEGAQNDLDAIDEYNRQLSELINGTGGNTEQPDKPTPEEPKSRLEELMETAATKNETVLDKYGNPITVPQGFKVVSPTEDSTVIYAYDKVNGTSTQKPVVQDGIVIKDSAGNQFVWIPVGEIKNDAVENTTNKTPITLGRYSFNLGTFDYNKNTYSGTGEEKLEQAAYTETNPTNYINTDGTVGVINEYYTELSIQRNGLIDTSNRKNDLNATAKNLAGFVGSVNTNGGYYIARYEASYGSGYNNSEGATDPYANAKPLSQPSKENSESSMNYTPGTLWNFITQINASKVARNMYAENKDINNNEVGVESDLINSYAWDTAIVFIQKYSSNTAYSKQNSKNTGSLADTGERTGTTDKVCNIYDMASNSSEWTTEYSTDIVNLFDDSTNTFSSFATPCVSIGGRYNNSTDCTADRGGIITTSGAYSFRPTLYVRSTEP